jgi:hypothetical protein
MEYKNKKEFIKFCEEDPWVSGQEDLSIGTIMLTITSILIVCWLLIKNIILK